MVRDSRSPGRSRRSEYPDRGLNGPRNYPDSRRPNRYPADDDYRRGGGRDDSRRDTSRDDRAYEDSARRRRSRSLDRRRGDRRDPERYPDRDRDRERREPSLRGEPSRRSASPPQRRSRSRPGSANSRSKSPEDKTKPNFNPSGLLAAATKTVQHADGTKTVLKYHEPPEARKPTVGWRLYVFKGKEQVDLLHIHRQSAYLVGRDRLVADIAVEHPSCSKQHAAIQFRQVHEKNEFGDAKTAIKPFIIDLESTNGTVVNDETVPPSRYYELKLGDVIKFGESAREYVLLSEDAA